MSALALVTGRLAPGVWRGGSMPSSDLAALADGLGWPVRRGEISTTDDKATYLEQLGTIAGVPAYVRHNWDSLADGLTDTGISSRRLLVIETSSPMPFDAIAIEVLEDAIRFWAKQGATMQVAWFGPVTAPALDDVDPVRLSRRSPG